MQRPKGSLKPNDTHTGRLYYVYSERTIGFPGRIDVEDCTLRPNPSDCWFNGEHGYIFDNYFHALAYSLKCKEKERVSRRL